MSPSSYCFTKHRPIPAEKYPEVQRSLTFQVIRLINRNVRYFYVGGHLGFDMKAV